MLSSCRPAPRRNKKWRRQHTSQRRRWQSYERLSAKLVSTANRKDAAEVWSCSKLFSHVPTSCEEMEITPALICCVTETTEGPFPATAGLLDETPSARCRAMSSHWREMVGQWAAGFMKQPQKLYRKPCWKYSQVFSKEYCLFLTNYFEGKKFLF